MGQALGGFSFHNSHFTPSFLPPVSCLMIPASCLTPPVPDANMRLWKSKNAEFVQRLCEIYFFPESSYLIQKLAFRLANTGFFMN
jgi:hypothetical protein